MTKLFWIAAFAAAQLTAQETMPPGAGKQLVLDTCVQCHDFKWMTAQPKSEAEWRQTVNVMIWRGAPLMPGEAETIAKYLVQWNSASREKPREAAGVKSELPPGAGRELVAAQCVGCHDLSVTASERKSLADWRHSVEEMVRLGAKLTGSEVEVVSRYLARSFGVGQ